MFSKVFAERKDAFACRFGKKVSSSMNREKKNECTTLLSSTNVEEVTELEKVELQIIPMKN